VKDPKRTYPLAMVLSVVLMLVTYLFPIATAIATAKDWSTDISQGSYPILAEELGFGSWLLYMMIAGGLVSTMGTYCCHISYTCPNTEARHLIVCVSCVCVCVCGVKERTTRICTPRRRRSTR
jgi:amino acid transporter